jgi:DNA polymerase-3 subunit delta'
MKLYPWQIKDWQTFQSLKTGQAILLVGNPGIGAVEFARHVALAMLCQGSPKPCGCCQSCQWFMRGSHPDFWEITEEKEIGVDAIRQLNQWIFKSPHKHGKVAFIASAEKMTPFAVASILKTLEEPPSFARFLLTTTHVSLLAPTMVSRTQVYQLCRPAKKEALAWLEQEEVKPAAFFLTHAYDLPLVAKTLANSDYYKQYQLFIHRITQNDYDGLSRLSLELPKFLELWRKWAFDLMWYHQKRYAVFTTEYLDILAREASILSSAKIAKLWEMLDTFTQKNTEVSLQQNLQIAAIAGLYAELRA